MTSGKTARSDHYHSSELSRRLLDADANRWADSEINMARKLLPDVNGSYGEITFVVKESSRSNAWSQ